MRKKTMECYTLDILRLLKVLAAPTKKNFSSNLFSQIHGKMEKEKGDVPFSEKYLNKKLYPKVREANERNNMLLHLNREYVEFITSYLGYSSYEQFLELPDGPTNEVLEGCVGDWYSYVRCNSGEAFVLVSPVNISAEGREVFMKLDGKERKFKGRMRFEGNCIYCLLESKQEKNIHLVLSVGFAKRPNVLQGVFSGISTAGDPIAGREVLVRQPEGTTMEKSSRKAISKMIANESSEQEKLIGAYFKKREGNILKAHRSSTYDLGDLEEK